MSFEFAFGLGKVGRLINYEVVALDQILKTLPVKEATKRDVLGGEDSPRLRELRKRCPYMLLPVVFVNAQAYVALCCPNVSERNPRDIFCDPVERCDKQAAEHFRPVQRFKFPDVTIPELR